MKPVIGERKNDTLKEKKARLAFLFMGPLSKIWHYKKNAS